MMNNTRRTLLDQTVLDQTSELFGLPIFSGKKNELLEHVAKVVFVARSTQLLVIFTPNPEQVVLSRRDGAFKQALLEADVLLPDGAGLVLASKLLSFSQVRNQKRITERIAGGEFMLDLCKDMSSQIASSQHNAFLIIGGAAGIAERAASFLQRIFPGLRVKGMMGCKDALRETKEEWVEIQRVVQEWKPSVVCVAFGAPKQELWTMRHRDELQTLGVRVVLVIGGAVDVLAGQVVKCPAWISSAGFEWLWRLVHEPWRWRRQLTLISFSFLVMKEWLRLQSKRLLLFRAHSK